MSSRGRSDSPHPLNEDENIKDDDPSQMGEESPNMGDSDVVGTPTAAGEKRKVEDLDTDAPMPKSKKMQKELTSKPNKNEHRYSDRVLDIFEQSVIYGIIDKV